jgi:hypothetical protein
MKKLALLLALTVSTHVCFCQQEGEPKNKNKVEMKKTEDKRTPNGHLLITAEVIEKARTDDKGKILPGTDLYVRRSAQDYFIKFSESAVTMEAVKNEMDKMKHDIKSFTMETEIRNGLWDSCDGTGMTQSRTGVYIVIHRLIAK